MQTAQLLDAHIEYDGRSLLLWNDRILRAVSLTKPLFQSVRLVNKRTETEWIGASGGARSTLGFAGHDDLAESLSEPAAVTLTVERCPLWEKPYVVASVETRAGDLKLRRSYAIYPGCPATVCWTEVSGSISHQDRQANRDRAGRRLLPESPLPPPVRLDLHDGVFVCRRHLRIRNVRLTACTDFNDSYVQKEERDAFDTHTPWLLEGNLLFAECLASGDGLFLIKEAPDLRDQPDHPAADFVCDFASGMICQSGWGITSCDLEQMDTVTSWRTVLGVSSRDAPGDECVKSYLGHRCLELPGRDWLLTANQWGDRREGRQLTGDFVQREVDRCADLGIEAYMLDAGWQMGDISGVAPGAEESPFYGDEDFWAVDRAKFPDGLRPLTDYARDRGVQLLFWHNPDFTAQNANYERDAALLTTLWRDYGACALKIDGVWNVTRLAETRNRAMLESVIAGSGGEVTFQLDITQGVRWGFLGAIPLGILFVENRYTHWKNYFPYKVHRNLWELAQYLRPQRLQFEFLNNVPQRMEPYRPDYSPDDPFTPEKYGLDYLFATVMFSNPLAFMEPSALTEEQCETLRPILSLYREIRDEMFQGEIYPLGEKPSGRSLTAFQSHHEASGTGFVCAYREVTERSDLALDLRHVPDAGAVRFTHLIGCGEATVSDGRCCFSLPNERSYALFRYEQK